MASPRGHCLLLLALLLAGGCGKKGPMTYPDMMNAQAPQQLSVEQSGSALRLSFALPTKDRAGRKLEDLEAILVGRRTYQQNDCASCQDRYQELQKINLAFPEPAQIQGGSVKWLDREVRNGERYQYRLKTVQKGGVEGSEATTALVQVQPAPPVPALKAEQVFGGLIKLEIRGAALLDSSLVGYSLYRSEGTAQPQPLVTLTAGGTGLYEDQSVQVGVEYRYVARMVVKRADGVIAESDDSAPVVIRVGEDPK